MNARVLILLGGLLAASTVREVAAQPLGLDYIGGLNLISDKEVRNELGLGDEQAAQVVEKVRRAVWSQHQDEFQGLDENESQRKLDAISPRLRSEIRISVAAALDPERAERLEQLRLQNLGVFAFTEPEIRESLGISQKQSELIGKLAKGFDAERSRWRRIIDRSEDSNPEQLAEEALRKKFDEAQAGLQSILDKNQRKKYLQMIGKKLDKASTLCRIKAR